MPISLECPCGKALRVQDNLVGKKVKCPICGEILDVPIPKPDPVPVQNEVFFNEIPPEPRIARPSVADSKVDVPDSATLSLTGKAAAASWRQIHVSALFGQTTLTLRADRLVEDTKILVTRRHAEILLSQIDSAELLTTGNHLIVALSLLLADPTNGISLVFLLLYFLKSRFLVVRSKSTSMVVVLKKRDEEASIEFLNAILTAAAEQQRG